jgi:putative endonuclease
VHERDVGTARNALEARVAEHNAGLFGGYTAIRRPVSLIFSQYFGAITMRLQQNGR